MESYYSRGWATEQLSSDLENEVTSSPKVIEMFEDMTCKVDNAGRVYEKLGASPEEKEELMALSNQMSSYECLLYDVAADIILGNIVSQKAAKRLAELLTKEQFHYLISLLQQEEQNVFRERRG